jgi:parallel beta-helix repeat protein
MKKNQKSIRAVVASSANRRTRRQTLRSALPELLENRTLMSTYSVTTTADSGSGSLRQAVTDLNNSHSAGEIDFAIANDGSVQTISPSSSNGALPAITEPVKIDGTTEPLYAGKPLIELSGANVTGNGLDFEAGSAGSQVLGLTIDSFSGAGVVLNSGGATLSNDYIGTDPTGTVAKPSHDGVDIHSDGNTLNGNLISGNNFTGVWVSGDGNTLTGNSIGTDVTGELAVPNSLLGPNVEAGGVVVDNASNTTIGGSTSAARNVISGNDQDGIVFSNDAGSGNLVEGNDIGMDAMGQNAVVFSGSGNFYTGNNGDGIDLGTFSELPVSNVLIENNLISGNQVDGVYMSGASGNTVAGNIIGFGADGKEQVDSSGNLLGNQGDGIAIDVDSSGNTIGGLTAASRNVIGGSAGNEISVHALGATSANVIEGNYIGTDSTGFVADPSTDDINVSGGVTLIGGSAAGAGNVISGAFGYGIAMTGGSTTVYGNIIGAGPDGVTAVPNDGDGIRIQGSSNDVIGGDQPGQGNVIAFNSQNGVNVLAGANATMKNAIEGNSIYGNTLIGIDLGNDGPTPNGHDGTAGPNHFQFFPVLDTTVGNDGTTATVTGTMTGPVGATYTIDFYTNATADPTGYGQGQVFQGSEQVTIGSGGSAQVSFSAPTPAGTVWTATATDSVGNSSEFALDVTEGQPTSLPNSISGVVTTDLTGNGFSADDTPLAGVTIDLFENGGATPVATAVSGSDGTYSFTGLSAGSYTLQEVVPTGSTETGGASGYTITATSGVNSTRNNFDNFQNVSMSGVAYNDLTGNGFSSDDTPLAGVTVDLFENGGTTPAAMAVTASNGTYSFTNLGPGSYSVQEVVPAGSIETGGNAGYTVSATSGSTYSGDNFDNVQSFTISGKVYNDLTGNGITSDDTALAGVTVQLLSGSTIVASTTSAADGSYSFANVGSGSYTVSEVVPSGSTQTAGLGGYTVTAQSGHNVSGDNFADFQNVTISGTVYSDLTGNGITADDTTEAGVTVQLLTGSSVVATMTSGSNGAYSFTNVGPGSYTIQEIVPSGATQTVGTGGYSVLAQSGKNMTGDNFANFQAASISGTMYQDLTGNGFSADDTLLGGVTVDLFRNGSSTPTAQTITAANGTYSFTNLAQGSYFVQEVVPSGWIETGGLEGYTISATGGSSSTGNNFDNFHDVCDLSDITCISYVINGCTRVTTLAGNTHEGDQVQVFFTLAPGYTDTLSLVSYTAPESTFVAADASKQVVFDSQSGTFTGGTHSLTITIPVCYYQIDFVCGPIIDHFGPAGSNVFYTPQGRKINSDNSGTDAQFSGGGELSGFVYDDLNADKTDDGKDTGIAGVIVTLTGTDSSGHQVHLTRTTAANGAFYFMGLRAGTYTITETQPSGYTSDATDVGTVNGATDGKAVNTAGGQITNIVLKFGADGVSYDFGEIKFGCY